MTPLEDLEALAPVVVESEALADRERGGRRPVSRYRLRESGQLVYVRHGTTDLAVLEEVFRKRLYELPPPVAEVLDAAEPPLYAVDLGGNIGLFGLWLLGRYPSARIIAFEPDPANLGVLDRCIEANEAASRWRVVPACASNEDGVLRFREGDGACSQIAGDHEAEGATEVEAVDVFPYLQGADFLKMDMEGGEWAILEDARFRAGRARVVALEYHPHLCPTEDPRGAAERRLAEAGYAFEHVFEKDDGVGMHWAWREQ